MPFRASRRTQKAARGPIGRTTRTMTSTERVIADGFVSAVRGWREQIASAISYGDLYTIVNTAGAADIGRFIADLQPIVDALHQEVQAGGTVEARSLGNLTTVGRYRFDVLDPRAYTWAEVRAGLLISEVSAEQSTLLRAIVAEGVQTGQTVDAVTETIRQNIGLHERWSQAVRNTYSREYDRMRNVGATHAAAERAARDLSSRQSARLLDARARNIARTEIITAANQGRHLSWVQGVEAGFIAPNAVKRWTTGPLLTRSPGRIQVCDECRMMYGQERPWNKPFSNGVMMPPAHPSCRCSAELVPTSIEDIRSLLGEEPLAVSPDSLATLEKYGIDPVLTTPPDVERLFLDPNFANESDIVTLQRPEVRAWRDRVIQRMQAQPDDIQTPVTAADSHVKMRLYTQKNQMRIQQAYSTAGYPDSRGTRFIEKVKKEKVVVNMPADTLEMVVADGRIKTQFETQTSKGLLAPGRRREVESTLFGMPHDAPAHMRPVYGSINSPYKVASGRQADSTWLYGDTRLVMKPSVRRRTTVTGSDSLDRMTEVVPSLASRPREISASYGTSEGFYGYLEAQIWGGVSLSDVSEVVLNGMYIGLNQKLRDPGFMQVIRTLNERKIKVTYINGKGKTHRLTGLETVDDLAAMR